MRTAKELEAEIMRLDSQLAECRNLVSALVILVDDLAEASLEGYGATVRDGIVGVTWALRREIGMSV